MIGWKEKMIYDFKCKNCGYEERDKRSDKPLENTIICPKCGQKTFEKIFSTKNVLIKFIGVKGEKQ